MRWLLLFCLLCGCGEPLLFKNPPIIVRDTRLTFEEQYMSSTARMRVFGGVCTMSYHPDAWFELKEPMKWWVLGHELAHCEDPTMSESAADCAGLRYAYGIGVISDEDLTDIVEIVQTWHATEDHPGGALRAINLLACTMGIDRWTGFIGD